MYLGLCIIGVIVLTWVVTATTARPSTDAEPSARDLERRRAQLRTCPDRATILDVERLMRAHPLPDETVARVLGAAAERRISSRTLWCWADRFGADKLVVALDADVAERRMQRHLDARTVPDWDAMDVFAGLNHDTADMPIQEILDLDAVLAVDELSFDVEDWSTTSDEPVETEPLDLAQFEHLPPIVGPGLDRPDPTDPGDGPQRGHWAA